MTPILKRLDLIEKGWKREATSNRGRGPAVSKRRELQRRASGVEASTSPRAEWADRRERAKRLKAGAAGSRLWLSMISAENIEFDRSAQLASLRSLREAIPWQDQSAADLVRQMRDDRY